MPTKTMPPYINRRGLRVESGGNNPSSHKDRKPERVAMSTITKIRKVLFFTITAFTVLLLTACSSGGYGKDLSPQTSKFVFDNFTESKFFDPFETSKGDVGSTMESLVQLTGVGYTKETLNKSIMWLTENTNLLSSPGLVAQYIFTAHAVGFQDDPSVATQLETLKKIISADGSVPAINNFSYSWVVLGLLAADEKELAQLVAKKLFSFIEPDGGLKYAFGDVNSLAATDVTAFALMSFKAVEKLGTAEDQAAMTLAINRTKNWLMASRDPGYFWLTEGDVDISGSAYAIMALSSVGENVEDSVKWLRSQIIGDGGIATPWSAPDSDLFSSNQSILALSNLNFIDTLNNSK